MIHEKELSPLKNITAEFAINLRIYLLRKAHSAIDDQISRMIDLLDVQTPEKLQYFQ